MAELCSQPRFLQVVLKESAESADCAGLLCPRAVASVWEGRGKKPVGKPLLRLPADTSWVPACQYSPRVDLCCIWPWA